MLCIVPVSTTLSTPLMDITILEFPFNLIIFHDDLEFSIAQ